MSFSASSNMFNFGINLSLIMNQIQTSMKSAITCIAVLYLKNEEKRNTARKKSRTINKFY